MWKFKPILKSTIWGGSRIIPFKRLDVRLDDVGESWEISGVPGMETVVESGLDAGLTVTQLVDKYGPALMGEKNYKKYGDDFPLLVKFIDARAELSVQVHPDDALAQRRGHKWGKTEMWYIVEAAKGARIASGFRTPVDPADYDSLVESGRIEGVLGYIDVRPGEVYMTPAGRVHAIGRGCFLVEIQQTSDLTYRICDYHRRDSEGKERGLHTERPRSHPLSAAHERARHRGAHTLFHHQRAQRRHRPAARLFRERHVRDPCDGGRRSGDHMRQRVGQGASRPDAARAGVGHRHHHHPGEDMPHHRDIHQIATTDRI